MKKSLFFLLIAFAAFVTGCSNSTEKETTTPTATPPANTPAEQTSTPPADQAPVITPVTPESAPTTVTPSGTAKINPPHGQPGHSCDFPVGAPLP